MFNRFKVNIFRRYNRFYKKTNLRYRAKAYRRLINKTLLIKTNRHPVAFDYILQKGRGAGASFFFFKKTSRFFMAAPLDWGSIFFLKTPLRHRFKKTLHAFRYLFFKVKFFGKSFRWIFTKKKIKFKVQKAHKTYVLFKFLRFSKKKKFKFKVRAYYFFEKLKMNNFVKEVKYSNLFTRKGLRVLKTKFFKKKGKVSGYMVGL